MTRGEYWLATVWAFSGVWTLLSFTLYGIPNLISVLLILTMIGFPIAMLLALMPTTFLYLTLAAPAYLLLRRDSRLAGFLLGIVPFGLVGFLVPSLANQSLAHDLKQISAKDHGSPIRLAPDQKVALLVDATNSSTRFTGDCAELCQRLLFSGTANEVLAGPASALQTGRGLRRYWIEKAHGVCRALSLAPVYADDADVGQEAPYPRPLLYAKLSEIYAKGQCLYAEPTKLERADVVFVDGISQHDTAGHRVGAYDLGFPRPAIQQYKAIYIRSEGKLKEVMRRPYAVGQYLTLPLMLEPPSEFDTYQEGRWRREKRLTVGKQFAYPGSQAFLVNDLRVEGLAQH
ncbi:MAG TPA: hypothetical protein VGE65_10680 [Sphingobium sp.]